MWLLLEIASYLLCYYSLLVHEQQYSSEHVAANGMVGVISGGSL